MGFVIQIIKAYVIVLLFFINTKALSQGHISSINLTKDWKCIKFNYKGIEKFTFKQAEEIRRSILHIGKHNYSFSKADFIKTCSYYEWKIKPFADADDSGRKLEVIYNKTQIKKIYLIEAVDKNENEVCYNDCIFLKNKQILISNCGGYIFYLVKVS